MMNIDFIGISDVFHLLGVFTYWSVMQRLMILWIPI